MRAFKGLQAIALSASALLLMNSCGNNTDKAPDISNIKVSVRSMRFDKDMYAIDTNHIGDGLKQVKQKYPDFMDFFIDTVMTFGVRGNYTDTSRAIRESVHEYLTYKDFVNLQDTINHYYPDTKAIDETLNKGFAYMKSYLPAFTPPKKVIYANHLLTKVPPVFCVDTNITCVCLDMFVGPQFPFYKSVGVPDYMGPHLVPAYIPVAVFRTTFESLYQYPQEEQTLLELMIQQGKEQYFLHKVLPGLADSTLFGFTGTEVKWCETNEAAIYNYFIQNNLLYNKRDAEVRPYVTDGPFAHNLGSASEPGVTPGNIGGWMGYRIISAYMANNSAVSMEALLSSKADAAKLLQEAKYKPK